MIDPLVLAHTEQPLTRLALGGSLFGAGVWDAARAAERLATLDAALAAGINHFDTAAGYGDGVSEQILGKFIADQRDQVFVASKAASDEMSADRMLEAVDQSLARLQTDQIDLFYIHWPRAGKDARPLMEGLERARAQGKIRLVGVSNFDVEQMAQVAEVGRIDAHQLNYSLLWRFAEADVIPYCRAHGIALVTYASIAQGVLTGKFACDPGGQIDAFRAKTVHFDPAVWGHVYAAVEQMKQVAAEIDRPLTHLAIRWVLHQPGINSAVVSAKTPDQLGQNAAALAGDIPDTVFNALTTISDEAMQHIPATGNMYRYYP
jgi:aryl-alcohol dehydrogenase-like predicted oxidoreductase